MVEPFEVIRVGVIDKPSAAAVPGQVKASVGVEGFVALLHLRKVRRGCLVQPLVHGGQVDVLLYFVAGVVVFQVSDFRRAVFTNDVFDFGVQLRRDKAAHWGHCGLDIGVNIA